MHWVLNCEKFCKFHLLEFNCEDSLYPKLLLPSQIYCDLLLWQSFCGYQMLKRQKLYYIVLQRWSKLIQNLLIQLKLLRKLQDYFKKSRMKGFTYCFHFQIALMWMFGSLTKWFKTLTQMKLLAISKWNWERTGSEKKNTLQVRNQMRVIVDDLINV